MAPVSRVRHRVRPFPLLTDDRRSLAHLPRSRRAELLGERAPEPTDDAEEPEGRTIFGPDHRFIFHDHTYPFVTVGRVSNS